MTVGAAVLDGLVAVRRIVRARVRHVDGRIGQRRDVAGDAVRFAQADCRTAACGTENDKPGISFIASICEKHHEVTNCGLSINRQFHLFILF